MTVDCDVLIVGGGPAGLTAAKILSDNEYEVVITEKGEKIGNSNLKLDITEGDRIQKILKQIKIKANKTSNRSEWISKHHKFVFDSQIQDLYFIRGNSPDSIENSLYTQLSNNNDYVSFLFNSELDSIKKKEDNIEYVVSNGKTIRPRHIIISEGKSSFIEQELDIKSESLASFVGLGAVVCNNEDDLIPHTQIYFDERVAPGGYIYCGSIEYNSFFCVVIDSLFQKKVDLKKNLFEFIKLKYDSYDIKNYFRGYGTSGVKETVKGNVSFVGGSAFYHDPFLGYGLNFAIESAYYAAHSIINENVDMYMKYSKNIQNEIKNLFFARKIWRKADNIYFDKLITVLNGREETEDSEINRIVELFSED